MSNEQKITPGTRHPETDRKVISAEDFQAKSRRSFLVGLAFAGFGGVGLRQLANHTGEDDSIAGPLRSVHNFNAAVWESLYNPNALAPTFDQSEQEPIRVNGRHGVREEIDLDSFVMQVIGRNGEVIGEHDMDDLHSFPYQEMTIEHKCVEGWSGIVTWGGTLFTNFAALYADEVENSDFVNMETPDGVFQVNMDMASMLHPQTMLTWTLNQEPLSQLQGAPIRLTTPLKYGIKQIKRIARLEFSNTRGPDYWEIRGYDWFSGL